MVEVGRPAATVLVVARRETEIPLRWADGSIAVTRTDSGAGALAIARAAPPAVIIVDLVLPDAQGLEVCRLLRADLVIDRSVPILLVSRTEPTPEQRVAGLRFGAWGFVQLPADEHELSLKVRLFAEAKHHFDNALATDRLDSRTGVRTAAELVRHAQQLGSLMYRVHEGLACVVFEVEGPTIASRVATAIARSTRASDVVGQISPDRIGVVAPATNPAGAVLLARRIGAEARRVMVEQQTDLTFQAKGRLLAGYDAVANARYSPVDPVGLIRNASFAVRHGSVEAGETWLRAAATIAREAAAALDHDTPTLNRSTI